MHGSSGSTDLTFVQNVQTGSVAHPTYHSMDTGNRVKCRVLKLISHFHLVPRLRMSGATPLLPMLLHGLYWVTFTFTAVTPTEGQCFRPTWWQCTSVSKVCCPRKLCHRGKSHQRNTQILDTVSLWPMILDI
jgi:hypothetical protein